MATEFKKEIDFFLGNEFWYIGSQSPHFCKWPIILKLSKWILLLDIPSPILRTIMPSVNVYVLGHTKEKPSQRLMPCVKVAEQYEIQKSEQNLSWKCILLISILPIQNWKFLLRTRTLTVGTAGLVPRRNRLNFQTWKSPFCFLLIKILQLKCYPEYFGVFFLQLNHQARFKWVHSSPNEAKLQFVSLHTHNPSGWP